GHGGRGTGGGFGIAQVVVADRLEVVIQFIDERDAVGDVQADDVGVGDAVQVLDQGADRVAVGGHHHAPAAADGWGQGLVPERDDAGDGVLEALGQGHVGRIELLVAAGGAPAA